VTAHSFILATDLDGTFLGGDDRDRTEFYKYIENNRDRLLLIFATGRGINSISTLCQEPGFPEPDYVIGDVGTTISHWQTRQPVAPVQNWVDEVWNDAGDRIKDLLEGEVGLELQPIDPTHRVSYYYKPAMLQPSTLTKITEAGFDYVMSGDRYLDVMPKGVSKGPSLLKLIEHLNLNPEDVIPAGDSLNDFSLFTTGLKSIAVSNSEPKLVEKIQRLPNVYFSSQEGAAGIWEGLKFYKKLP
jgi:HAD superfamily hydrolase (TIGR01484 family)